MDGFTDKLSQHFASPQDMISANGQAEATQAEQLQTEVKALIDTLSQKLNELQNSDNGAASDKLETHIHKENVRVYRNVQASVTDELGKQTEALNAELSRQNQNVIEELSKKIEELSAKVDAINEKSNGQEHAIKRAVRGKAVLPIQIIILIIVLTDLAVNVASLLGVLKF